MIISNLSFSYPDKQVLNNLSLQIQDRAITMIVAPSGYGKTTLFRAISGLIEAPEGQITGFDRVSYAFQEPRLLPWLSVIENVTVTSRKPDIDKARNLLLRLGFSESDLSVPASQLSGGMKQRVNIARALYYDSDLILLDEPFSSLDEQNISRVVELLVEAKKERTIIIISHEKQESAWVDKVIRLNEV